MDASGVDDRLSLPPFLEASPRFAHGCRESACPIALESDHPTSAPQLHAGVFCRQSQQQVESGVVELPIAVGNTTLAAAQPWQRCNQVFSAQPAAAAKTCAA